MDSPLQPDPYAILGLKHGASLEEVRRAYKRLAMRWHPDRNPAPDAHAQFSEIRSAYDRLTGNAMQDEEEQAPSGDQNGESHHDHVTLTLEEAAFGATREIVVTSRTPCKNCDGTGRRSYSRTTMCGTCFGSGRVRGAGGNLVRCHQCDGRGFITESLCSSCDGRGWKASDRTLQIQVPPGMLAGETLRLAGQGGAAPDGGGQAGDLFVEIRLATHPLFRLEGRDLHVKVPVSVLRRLTGGSITVPTLSGLRDIMLAPGGQNEMRIEGAGFPKRKERPAGDLLVHFHTVFPQHLNGSQLNLLRTADRMMESDLERQSPELAEWQRRLDELDRNG
ncbi:MAG: DnaJ domain-containing protein [Zoogloea sp.]|nr:DnaJ domain-containing protein [Zoogloea sp.]